MTKILFALIATAISLVTVTPSAEACSVERLDATKEAQDLTVFAAPALGIVDHRLVDIRIDEPKAHYLWTDPMCPEGRSVEAMLYVMSKHSPATCVAVVKVSKTEPTGWSQIPVKHEYKVEVKQEMSCTP